MQFNHIKNEIAPLIEELLTQNDGKYPDITKTLQKFYDTSTEEEIKKATENLTSVLKMTQGQDLDPKQAAQLIAERYA